MFRVVFSCLFLKIQQTTKYVVVSFFLQILSESQRKKAEIIMTVIVLNKVTDCSLPFPFIFVKYLALASVRSFQYWDSWDFHIILYVHSPHAHHCNANQNPSIIQGAYILRKQPKYESTFPFSDWKMLAALEIAVIQSCVSSLLLLKHFISVFLQNSYKQSSCFGSVTCSLKL